MLALKVTSFEVIAFSAYLWNKIHSSNFTLAFPQVLSISGYPSFRSVSNQPFPHFPFTYIKDTLYSVTIPSNIIESVREKGGRDSQGDLIGHLKSQLHGM